MHPLEAQLSLALQRISEQSSAVLIACSGGGDSVALLAALAKIAPSFRLRVEAAYVNHGIRSAAELAEEVEVIRTLARRLSLVFHCSHLACGHIATQAKRQKQSMEALAREYRYRILSRIMQERSISALVTAHHQDDNVESILLHLFQGHAFHLGGIPWERRLPYGTMYRPLLALRREVLSDYLASCGLPFHEDTSNSELSILRNRLRHCIVPEVEAAFPGFRKNLLRVSKDLFVGKSPLQWRMQGSCAVSDAAEFFRLSRSLRLAALYEGLDKLLKISCPHRAPRTYQRISHSFFEPLLGACPAREYFDEKVLLKGGSWCISLYKGSIIWYAAEDTWEQGYYFLIKTPAFHLSSCRHCGRVRVEAAESRRGCEVDLASETCLLRSVRKTDSMILEGRRVRVMKLLSTWRILVPFWPLVPLVEDSSGIAAVLGAAFGGENIFREARQLRAHARVRISISW